MAGGKKIERAGRLSIISRGNITAFHGRQPEIQQRESETETVSYCLLPQRPGDLRCYAKAPHGDGAVAFKLPGSIQHLV